MMTLYLSSRGSLIASRSSMPSVIYLRAAHPQDQTEVQSARQAMLERDMTPAVQAAQHSESGMELRHEGWLLLLLLLLLRWKMS